MIWHTVGIALVATGIGAAGAWRVQEWRHGAAKTEALEAAAETSRLQRRALTLSAERNDRATTQALSRAQASALGARGDLERVRNGLAAAAPGGATSATSCSDDGRLALFTRLLAEGAGLVEEGGRRVEQLAEQKAALQRHATEGP